MKQKIYGIGDAGAYHLQVVSWKNDRKIRGNKNANLQGKSPIEARLAEILRLINPNFKMNKYIGRYEVDFLYEKEKIVIEANGKAFHNPKKDAIKDNYLKKEGYLVIPVTGSDIMNRSGEVFRRIKRTFRLLGFQTYT
jgi:very-short-patch-repair endonuclease